jgi:hypothetical protein
MVGRVDKDRKAVVGGTDEAKAPWSTELMRTEAPCDAPKSDKCMCAESHIGHILGQTRLY